MDVMDGMVRSVLWRVGGEMWCGVAMEDDVDELSERADGDFQHYLP